MRRVYSSLLARRSHPEILPEEEAVIRYLLLGIVQGLTEFLPISSSGHLVLAEKLLNIDPPGVLLEAVLHLGTLLAVLFIFRKDVLRLTLGLAKTQERNELGRLVVGTLPIAILGFLFRERIEAAFSCVLLVGICLIITGGILLLADRASRSAHRDGVHLLDSLLIGLAQAGALLPGISRSGATIATGMLRGIQGRVAARFSFLLSIPAIIGGGGFKLYEALREPTVYKSEWGGLLLGALAAGFVGALAIKGLLAIIARGKLKTFGFYCLALGLASLIYTNVV